MGQLLGKQIQPRKLAGFAYDAGFKDAHNLVVAVMVILSESQGFDHAINTNPDGSSDRGIWQLNTIHAWITDEMAYDPAQASAAAFKLYMANSGFKPWAAFTSGVYLNDRYLQRACLGVQNHLAETLVARARNAGQTPLTPIPMVSWKQYDGLY